MQAYRALVLAHFGNKCQRCGSTKDLELHHIDGNRENNNPSNLILLCLKCHRYKFHNWGNTEKRTTVQIYESTRRELIKTRGELEAKDGIKRSFDDIVLELIRFWRKRR